MSIERCREHLARFGAADRIREFSVSSATVELAALAVGVIPARIAKTLSFAGPDGCLLIVAAGDARIDNKKYKNTFGIKARMLTHEQAVEQTGHAVGGVCPFGVRPGVTVCLDESLKRFSTVFPAAGSANSAIEVTCGELEEYSEAKGWVDVCSGWDPALTE